MNITPLLDDIDYLNDKTTDNDDYTKDIEDSNYDLKDLFASVNNFNDYLNDDDSVIENENKYEFGNSDTTHNDVLVKNVFDDHTNLIYQKSLNQNEYVKSIENRFKNLENNKINNELITRILKEETDIVEKEIDNLDDMKQEKTKMLKIQEYSRKRRNHQIFLLRVCSIILLVLFGIAILYRMNILGDTVFVSLIGTGLAIMVIFIGIVAVDMMFRDDHVYDEYKHTSLPSHLYLNRSNTSYRDSSIPLHQQNDKKELDPDCDE